MIENDDQLAIVLAHEMAHSLLLHSVSNTIKSQIYFLWNKIIIVNFCLNSSNHCLISYCGTF